MYEPWPPRDTDVDDQAASWPPRTERETGHELAVPLPDVDGETLPAPVDEEAPAGFLSPLHELRFVRETPGTVADHIDYAVNGAYAMPASQWRDAHVVWAYTAGAAGILLCRAIEWAFFHRLSRALAAAPVALALLWLLNQLPVVQWLVPDQWDVGTWFAVGDAPVGPGVVEMPIEVPAGGA